MTKQEFEAAAETWYQRAKSLVKYFRDENKEPEKRAQAYRLFLVMQIRVLRCIQVRAKIMQRPVKFQEGGFF